MEVFLIYVFFFLCAWAMFANWIQSNNTKHNEKKRAAAFKEKMTKAKLEADQRQARANTHSPASNPKRPLENHDDYYAHEGYDTYAEYEDYDEGFDLDDVNIELNDELYQEMVEDYYDYFEDYNEYIDDDDDGR